MRWHLAVPVFLILLATATTATAQANSRPRDYDKLDAGREAYQLGEQQRQFQIGRQVWLNDQMVLWSRTFPGWMYFAEPWPFLPGDIYGYPLAEPPINQPIGRSERRIGPNKWLSRPVYGEDLDIQGEPGMGRSGPREF